jgi:peroxiredoxin
MTNVGEQDLDAAFRRVRDLDASVAEQLRAFADAGRQNNPDFAAAVDRLVERLRQYGAGDSAPEPGDPLPLFVLPDDSGRRISLNELLARGPVAVTFHRGHWCPYCRININALAQAHQEIAAEGGQIVAIMPDLQKFVAEFRSGSEVPFPILTDMDNGYALSLNLTIWVGVELQRLMEGRRNLPEFQGNSSWMLPIPATFIVGRDGRIRARFMDPDYRKRMAIADMLAALRSSNYAEVDTSCALG